MALNPTPAPSSGILAAVKGALGIFDNLNKSGGMVGDENQGTPMDEYESSLSDREIIELTRTWRQKYIGYYTDVEASQRLAFKYWIGAHRSSDLDQVQGEQPIVDNLIFEAVETFLPIATRSNPDPLVSCDPSDLGQALAKDLKNALVYEADRQKLRMLLKKVARHWLIYRIGILKMCWNPHTQQIETEVVNPKRMIFDVQGYVDTDCTFCGEYVGEKRRLSAEKLVQMFPSKAGYIMQQAQGKTGTFLDFWEWHYHGTDMFFTMQDVVLGKYKNPHWNWDGEEEVEDPTTHEKVSRETKGENFFTEPKAPYLFLAVFNTGIQPHDETSLILQNVPMQDMINRRERQIDKNIQRSNNGLVVNGKAFTDDQASLAATALRKGTAIRVPSPSGNGLANDVMNFPAADIPEGVFKNLEDTRSELKNIFGISGATPQGVASQDTARGQILVNQLDASRIGGGVTEYIEQLSDAWYCWLVQMMYVHYTEPHYITAAGINGGKELSMIHQARFLVTETLDITVKEGSLIPKDPLTQRNEAVELWSAEAIDPRTLYQKLDYPDPNEAAKQLILWRLGSSGNMQALQEYMPDLFQQIQQAGAIPQTQPGVGGPAVNQEAVPEAAGSPPGPGSPSAVEAEGKQLLQSVPVKA